MASNVKDATYNPYNNSITITYKDNVIVTQYFSSAEDAKNWLVEYGNFYGI